MEGGEAGHREVGSSSVEQDIISAAVDGGFSLVEEEDDCSS